MESGILLDGHSKKVDLRRELQPCGSANITACQDARESVLPCNFYPYPTRSPHMLAKNFIQNRLDRIAIERSVQLCYANESGSRVWGLASTDSDYDVRFIYQHSKEWYLQLSNPKDMIGPLIEEAGELDLAGWDLRKVFYHLVNSNAGVIEWLYSPIIYFQEEGFLEQVRELADHYFNPRKVAAHYLGIARGARKAGYFEEEKEWNLKNFFYYCRPILAAQYVINNRQRPPVVFKKLMVQLVDSSSVTTFDELIRFKESVEEKHQMKIPEGLDEYFADLHRQLQGKLTDLPKQILSMDKANALFRKLIGY